MLTIQANLRIYKKTSKARWLRKQKKCPAVVYGGKHNQPNLIIEFNQKDIHSTGVIEQLYLNNTLLLIIEDQQPITVKIKEIQYHPYKLIIIHIDYERI